MLAKDPVKRDQNRYRYCDNDPADYVDPTGEVANIVGGALLGGGFLSSVVSQKMSGGEIDWWKALGAGINGLITGATQGGLLASGAGIPAALFGNNLAGTAGSAAEQGIGSGKIDPVKSIIDGLSNAVGNRWYKSDGLKSAKDAFKRGAGSGAIISGLNYISDTLFQKPEQRGMGVGLLPGIAGAAFSPYNFLRNPRRGCGSTSPFVPGLGYSSARGYQYDLPKIESGSQSQSKRFSLKDLLLEMVIGGVTGGVSSAAFYGAGKGIERLKDGLRPSRGGREIYYRTMSPSDYDYLRMTGELPATGETFISPTKSFSGDYDGVTVKFELNKGTVSLLEQIGLSNGDRATLAKKMYPQMPYVSGVKWTENYAFFKAEGSQINIGLGKGNALEIFNSNINSYKKVVF